MPHPPVTSLDPALEDPALTAKCARLLDLAPEPDLWAMEQTRRSLVAHEHERWHEQPAPRRRRELDRLIAGEVAALAGAMKRLILAAEGTPG